MGTNINLSGSGFTYDQSAIPSNPQIGDTWRERDSSNNIVNEWTWWNNLYWAEVKPLLVATNTLANPSTTLSINSSGSTYLDSSIIGIYLPGFFNNLTSGFTEVYSLPNYAIEWIAFETTNPNGLSASNYFTVTPYTAAFPAIAPNGGYYTSMVVTPIIINSNTGSNRFNWNNINYVIPARRRVIGLQFAATVASGTIGIAVQSLIASTRRLR